LRKCLKLDALRKALKSLPKTLDDTYARILCDIDEEYSQDAFKILQWLAYSARPLQIEEVAEVIAVDIKDDPRFDPGNRLREPRDILTICSSLVTTAASIIETRGGNSYEIEELRLAHFSVKEYLISDRIRTGPAAQYTIEERAEEHIAQTCLIYLLYFRGPIVLTSNNVAEFRLASYAAEYWTQHARVAKKDTDRINQLSIELFRSESDAYVNWIRLFDLDGGSRYVNMRKSLEDFASPLYYASLAGLVKSARHLLETGADVNVQGGKSGNALQAASLGGHEGVVRLLLEKGAHVNAQGGRRGNALQAASLHGHDVVVRLLLEKGADVNAQGGFHDNALMAASEYENEAVVRLLLDRGADVNAYGGCYGNPLQAASMCGNEVVLQLLLEKGADVNAQGGFYGNALMAASECGNEAVVQVLLDKGADVNARGGSLGNALQAASECGNKAVIQLLLDKGADVNAQGGRYGNALQAASLGGHEAVVRLLLEKGANVNAQGGCYGNALQAALECENKAVVRLLLDEGAN
jgi:ankyrin repeat protein